MPFDRYEMDGTGKQRLPLRLTMGGQGANQIRPQQGVSTGDGKIVACPVLGSDGGWVDKVEG